MSQKRIFLILLVIIALGSFLRLYHITSIPLGLYPDEAMNGNNVLEAFTNHDLKVFYPENNGREGLFINIQGLSLLAFGNQPWALRVVSAIFGILTILGVYLLAKELFTTEISKFKALISKQSLNSNGQSSSRDSRLEFRDFSSEIIALLAAFFVATSYWHLNFSRIGFRAIMLPFISTFIMYFLLKGLRRQNTMDLISAGILSGLGFYTYLAFRFMPFVIAIPLLWYLWKWYNEKQEARSKKQADTTRILDSKFLPVRRSFNEGGILNSRACTPCLIVLYILVATVVATPLILYFVHNPQDFFGRTSQVSVFTAVSPVREFLVSNLKTIGMFFVRGDCNPRHNFACMPELHPLVAFSFAIGLFVVILNIISKFKALISKQSQNSNGQSSFRDSRLGLRDLVLLFWLIFMSLPETLTREGVPHALRSIGLIPPTMILAAWGAWELGSWIVSQFGKLKFKFTESTHQIERIQRELAYLFLVLLLWIPLQTYANYFHGFASNPDTYFAFSTDLWHLGQYLNTLPQETQKYVVVNLPGTDVRGIPMPAQTVMFATNTFQEKDRATKNLIYVLPNQVDSIQVNPARIEASPTNKSNTSVPSDTLHSGYANQPYSSGVNKKTAPGGKTIIAIMNGGDQMLLEILKQKFPHMHIYAPSDFVILEN